MGEMFFVIWQEYDNQTLIKNQIMFIINLETLNIVF